MTIIWDGVTNGRVLSDGAVALRHRLADAAKSYDWAHVLAIVREHRDLVNTARPGGASWFSPLHQAAHGNAPESVCEELVELGGWRMLENARGERPLDVAERYGHRRAIGVLRPKLVRHVPDGILRMIQSHFHAVIRERADRQVREAGLRLPPLAPLLEMPPETRPVWFAVAGMYGGFAYHLKQDGVDATLVAESWCRVVEGSGQRHSITSAGARLVAEGFV
ncbi:hypothetical protein DA075_19805 [Methylobacterium currus]|uniref:Uncharacterized protein n=1 Tax=Methylobacterium currus TaxID=2051553 RepID=A0A2R4WTV3_9HYPH|nr:hypothetical protein [Methylobacterium currus]AWB24974.1 hypothetical protein DA075_19805 [Methylobacterium currus]UHC17528.1 ankyrin repeat domain-containing protein [Methylobacterium currus]